MMLKILAVGAAVLVPLGVVALVYLASIDAKCYNESKKGTAKSTEKEENLYTDKKHSCKGCKHCTCKKEETTVLVNSKDDFQGCGDAGKEMDKGVKDVVEITDEISSVTESEVKEDLIDELKL